MLGKGNTTIADKGDRGATWGHIFVVEESAADSLVHGVLYPWGDGIFPLVARGSMGSEPRCASLAEWQALLPDLFQSGGRRGTSMLYVIARCRRLDKPLSDDDFTKLRASDAPRKTGGSSSHALWLSRAISGGRRSPEEQWVPYKWVILDQGQTAGVLYVWETPAGAPQDLGTAHLPAYPSLGMKVPGYALNACGRTGEAWWTAANMSGSMAPAGSLTFTPAKDDVGLDLPSVREALLGSGPGGANVSGRLAVASCTYYRVEALSSAH